MENQTITVGVTKSDGKHRLHKPENPGLWQNHYTIDPDGLVLCVTWDKEGPPRPTLLYFSADEPITAVGFSECEDGVDKHTAKGPCGGCFFLPDDIPGTNHVAVVENWGYQRQEGYYFSIWINGRRFDPQIYNEGEVHPPDGEGRGGKKGGLLGFLRRLAAAFGK